ncbi:MAG: triose-phosphate isomerase family protein [Microterricola sp.]
MSLKMYLDHRGTIEWCREVADIGRRHSAVLDGSVEVFVLPSFPSLPTVADLLADTKIRFGGQNLHQEDTGAYTGEVSGPTLRQIGCDLVEVGHYERRTLFGEDDGIVAAKVTAALRNGLIPVLCVGESEKSTPEAAAEESFGQLEAATRTAHQLGLHGRVIVAYEPAWAIGAAEPADAAYIRAVGGTLRRRMDADSLHLSNSVIYGGSAGPGLLTRLDGSVDGLFLGRFAHDPAALRRVLDEAATLVAANNGSMA